MSYIDNIKISILFYIEKIKEVFKNIFTQNVYTNETEDSDETSKNIETNSKTSKQNTITIDDKIEKINNHIIVELKLKNNSVVRKKIKAELEIQKYMELFNVESFKIIK